MPEIIANIKEGALAALKAAVSSKIFASGLVDSEKGIGLQRPVTKEMEMFDKISVRNDRQSTIKDVQKIAVIDPRVYRLLYKISADATVGGFSVRVEQAPTDAIRDQAQLIIDTMIDKCSIKRKLRGWMKTCIRDGDLFWEVIVDDSTRRVVRMKKLAAVITFSNVDSEGNFPKDKPAYHQEHPWTRTVIRTFEPWQIVQVQWDYEDGQPYGTSMFKASRLSYQRLDSGEKNLVIRRGVRAGTSRHHSVGNEENPGGWEEVEEYKERNKDTLDNPMNPIQDFFSNGLVDITELKGDQSLGEITDLEHFEGLIVAPTGVPYAYLGGGRERAVNRDVLEEQEEDYYRVIDDINATIEQGLERVFRFGLLLQGVNDDAVKFSFNWGAKDRDDIDAKVKRAGELQTLGFSFQTIFATVDLDEITLEEELERIERQVEEGIIPYGLSMKLDPNVMVMLGLMANRPPEESELEEKLEAIRELTEQTITGGRGGALLSINQNKKSAK